MQEELFQLIPQGKKDIPTNWMLEKINKFLETYNLQRLNQEEIKP